MKKEMNIIRELLSDEKGNLSTVRGLSWATLFAAIGYVTTCLAQHQPIEIPVLLSMIGAAFGGKVLQKPFEK